jgi:hypothetical protein
MDAVVACGGDVAVVDTHKGAEGTDSLDPTGPILAEADGTDMDNDMACGVLDAEEVEL